MIIDPEITDDETGTVSSIETDGVVWALGVRRSF
jgi:hypothetical protein